MFSRIVSAAQPEDLVRLYDLLGCFIHRMGYMAEGGDASAALGTGTTRMMVKSASEACRASMLMSVTSPSATVLPGE